MGYAFDAVAEGMGVVVEGVDTPFVADVGVSVEFDSVNYGISQSCVGTFVVYFSPKGVRPFFVQTHPHLIEQPQILFYRSISEFRG